MDKVICSNCKKEWPLGQTACSCGGTAKTHIVPESEGILFKGHSSLSVAFTEVVRTVWEKNWPLIIAYVILQLILAAISYFTNAWVSVGWSLLRRHRLRLS